MKNALFVIAIAAMIVSAASCDLKREDPKNYDSLFLGVYLGMERQAFFDHCWELNRQKIFTHGPTNESVEYRLTGELDDPVIMRFYPTFENDRIYEMPVLFSYEAWAPWNKQFASDSLLVGMLNVFKRWYGEDFKVLDHETMGTIYYKMDKERRINLFVRDDQYVQAVFTDLKVEKELAKAKAGKNGK